MPQTDTLAVVGFAENAPSRRSRRDSQTGCVGHRSSGEAGAISYVNRRAASSRAVEPVTRRGAANEAIKPANEAIKQKMG